MSHKNHTSKDVAKEDVVTGESPIDTQREMDQTSKEQRERPNLEQIEGAEKVTASEAAREVDKSISERVAREDDKKTNAVENERKRIHAEVVADDVASEAHKYQDITSGDIAKEDVKSKKNQPFDKEKKTNKMNRWLGRTQAGALLGLGAFALASAIDTNNRLSQQRDAERMVNQQERNLTRQMNAERQKQREQSYGYVDFGNIVHEMWNERIGHHKMGNAKFE